MVRGRDVIVIGASAGGVEALRELVRGLPADLPAAVFVVLHVSPHGESMLPQLLSRAGPLPATHPKAGDGERFRHGHIYVAPPDHHMVLDDGHVRVVKSAKENRHRPAVDPLFRSAARFHGRHVIGVILTGALDDGTAGLAAVERQGGATVVQDPEDALFPSMPRNALRHVDADHTAPLAAIPALLVRLAGEQVEDEKVAAPHPLVVETRMTTMERPEPEDVQKLGRTSFFTCPECHGTLWEIDDERLLRYRCHVGHALTAESLEADQAEALEATLWAAVRAFEERAQLSDRMAARALGQERGGQAAMYGDRAAVARRQAAHVRLLLGGTKGALGAEMVDGREAEGRATKASGR